VARRARTAEGRPAPFPWPSRRGPRSAADRPSTPPSSKDPADTSSAGDIRPAQAKIIAAGKGDPADERGHRPVQQKALRGLECSKELRLKTLRGYDGTADKPLSLL